MDLIRGKDRAAIKVSSLAGSSASFLAVSIIRDLGRPVLVVFSEEQEAARAHDQLDFYIKALDIPAGACHLPARRIYQSLPAQGQPPRTAALAAMTAPAPDRPAAVSASIDALMLRTTPPAAFLEHVCELRQGRELERDRFIETLIRSGYTAVSAVMEPGDFSVRGGIIDVFAAGASNPVRVELWDEEVESLREFDPDSQKSRGLTDRALAPPLKEVIVNSDSSGRAVSHVQDVMQRIKEGRFAGITGVDVIKSFGEILSRIERRDHFPGIESFLPAFFQEKACALDYLDSSWVIMYVEPFLCDQAFARTFSSCKDEWKQELSSGRFALPPDEHFIGRPRAEKLIHECSLIISGAEHSLASRDDSGVEFGAPRPTDSPAGPVAGIGSDLSLLRIKPEAEEPMGPFLEALSEFSDMGVKTLIVSPMPGKADRMRELLSAHGFDLPVLADARGALLSEKAALITVGSLQRGFLDEAGKLAVIPEAEIFGEKIRPQRKARPVSSFLSDLSDLSEDDYVVHVDHGVGIYRGLRSLEVQWIGEWDFVHERERPRIRVDSACIEYAGGAVLYVPVHRVNQISKYTGPTDTPPPLDTLGGTAWERLKKKVKRSIRDFAGYLLRIQAQRRLNRGIAFPAPDHTFREFEETFEYEETPDQLGAIEDVLEDMRKERPMDRVVCGDVGYGKTEVALRAAFLGAMTGRQVAVLVPTTILAQQHYETFIKRLGKYPLEVRMISRFLSRSQLKETLAGIEMGVVDITIGTHRLLSKDVRFRELGLLVIDEEHRFGVRHKERLRELKTTVDTLTLTATPIPRTLYMSLSGLRDLSIIDTPPPDRMAVHTELARADDSLIREAIERELRRGGQVFFVHNRVQTIEAAATKVSGLAPQARVAIAHGQMAERSLERVMHEFVRRNYDVLVCTAIIESGLDIPTVNTMIIDRAELFGLAQLYQLRGRIGRAKERGYCFLMIPARGILTREAAHRLKVLKEFTELGSGFRVAAHDLEIRGAGNLLGAEQSGHIHRIGIELYMKLLDDEIKRQQGESVESEIEPEIKLPIPAYLPEDYMPDQNQRISWYKRLSRARSHDEIASLREELVDRYGTLPEPVENLLEVSRIKVSLVWMRALELAFTGTEITLALAPDTRADVERVIMLATNDPLNYRITPDNSICKMFKPKEPQDLFPAVRVLLEELSVYNNIAS
jgi:transcription-repair coupling factor (superfamily II helicase)